MIKKSYKSVDINKLRRLQNSLGFLDNFDTSSESFEKVVDINDAKLISADLAKTPPIDGDKVAKIKAAISAGNYPLDLDKLSDALMQAYREMKS